ncbi:MAG: hypothetical protein RL235_758 [Chlamydiota bacterium]|jgi:hypothetical protein
MALPPVVKPLPVPVKPIVPTKPPVAITTVSKNFAGRMRDFAHTVGHGISVAAKKVGVACQRIWAALAQFAKQCANTMRIAYAANPMAFKLLGVGAIVGLVVGLASGILCCRKKAPTPPAPTTPTA